MIRQFDPKDFVITLAGHKFDELDADFLSVTTDFDRFSMVQGIDGDAARVRNKLRSGVITINLLQSSPSNNFLSYISTIDELTGLLVLPFLAKGKEDGSTTILAPSCFVTKVPDVEFGNSHKTRTWTLRSDNIIIFLAGLPGPLGGGSTTSQDIWNKLNPVQGAKDLAEEFARRFKLPKVPFT